MAKKNSASLTDSSGSNERRKPHPNSLANLKPFQPGQSGNPGGRKKHWLSDVFQETLEERLSDPALRQQFKDALWSKLLSEKVVGSMTLDKVLERTEGKVADQLQVSGDVALTISDRLAKARERAKK